MRTSLLSLDPICIWNEVPPHAIGRSQEGDTPTITPMVPHNCNGAAIVICPGGGYAEHADYEGTDYGRWLNERGIAAFVLRYRLGSHGYRFPAITKDIARAVRLVRAYGPGWGLDTRRVGVMGSSAGGHLAATLLTRFDHGITGAADPVEGQSSRPDFGILCYPVISMGLIGHDGTRQNLLGPEPTKQQIRLMSNELHVTSDTPPCFVWHTQDDEVVSVENSMVFATALQQQGVPFSLHIFPTGKHGIGLGVKNYKSNDKRALHSWTRDLETWLLNYGISSARLDNI